VRVKAAARLTCQLVIPSCKTHLMHLYYISIGEVRGEKGGEAVDARGCLDHIPAGASTPKRLHTTCNAART
jgi:hypothetical protein